MEGRESATSTKHVRRLGAVGWRQSACDMWVGEGCVCRQHGRPTRTLLLLHDNTAVTSYLNMTPSRTVERTGEPCALPTVSPFTCQVPGHKVRSMRVERDNEWRGGRVWSTGRREGRTPREETPRTRRAAGDSTERAEVSAVAAAASLLFTVRPKPNGDGGWPPRDALDRKRGSNVGTHEEKE